MPSGFLPTPTRPAIVVGAGTAGLALANALQSHGIPFLVIERGPVDAAVDGHVLLYPPALQQLGAWGVAEPLLAEGRRLRAVTLARADGGEERVDLTGLRDDTPFPFVLACRASRLREVLRARIPADALRGHAEVVRVQAEDDQVLVDVRLGDTMQVDALRGTVAVGCDGSGSLLRRRLKIAFDQVPEERTWVMAEVSTDGASRDDLALSADWARVPLGAGRERWVLALGADEDGLELDRPDALAAAAAQRWGTAPALSDVSCYRYYSMHDRVAREWRNGRVFLAGRAAHLTNPVWDADASLSVADAALLASTLATGEPAAYGEQRRASLERVLAPDAMAWLRGGVGLVAAREWMLVSS